MQFVALPKCAVTRTYLYFVGFNPFWYRNLVSRSNTSMHLTQWIHTQFIIVPHI